MAIHGSHPSTKGVPIDIRKHVLPSPASIFFNRDSKIMIHKQKNHPKTFCKNYIKMLRQQKNNLTALILKIPSILKGDKEQSHTRDKNAHFSRVTRF
jgi:hypothetical protein